MQLSLSPEERVLLEKLVEQTLMDLRVETRRTTTPSFHDAMVEDEGRLRELLDRIRELAGTE